ncbi:AAA family ATPase [Micromonospora sp. WMMD1076]|uniref:ATP-binding protein n=1 Tax=Micromonospora sp. WMMD1076 TaxID=3016103 RepID=UPI00249C8C70|nr:LuxR family transcriptional regulator [Micromonospora sp. WMMD1076]WFF05831.1 AAA family ATPase [Micromonospora sp. WMMD1076]
MGRHLLERDAELGLLADAVAGAFVGQGSIALVTGEAGIGKTSIVRTFADRVRDTSRLLLTACDDLMAPRTLGALRDAPLAADSPLAVALADDRRPDRVFPALLDELAREAPTVLVVEDVHWADDATLDLLLYAARRIESIGAVLVLTYRDSAAEAQGPLHRLLGALAGCPVRRMPLAPLSPAAVASLSAGTGRDAAAVYAITGGNPFFVTESLAAGDDALPASIVEAVLARFRQLSRPCRDALAQLSVVPSYASFDLAGRLLGPAVDVLAEAELAGVVEVRADSLTFRHELARRVVEQSLPTLLRRRLNQAVVTALRAQGRPEQARLVHHAVQAGDVATLLEIAPDAAREAAAAGAHRQALVLFESVLPYLPGLAEAEQAAVLDDAGWELYNAHRFQDAVRSGREAARRYERLGDRVAQGGCLVRVSRHLFMTGMTDEAEQVAREAVDLLGAAGDDAALAHACLYLGAILALTGRPELGVASLEVARRLAARSDQPGPAVLCLNYLGGANAELGDPTGRSDLRASIAASVSGGFYEYAARGYTNLAELLYREGRLTELDDCVRDGLSFTRERGFWSHAYNLEVHRCLLLLRRGDWAGAEAGLRLLVDSVDDPGMLFAYSEPWLARLAARRGAPAAGPQLARVWERATAQRLQIGVAYAGIAYLEWAWLADRPHTARAVADQLLPRLQHPGAALLLSEALRYLALTGVPVTALPGGPEPYASVLRGDWQSAAAQWRAVGDPYETALALAGSGRVSETLEAVRMLDDLGATAAADRVRDRLRALGSRVPRGPQRQTRANPAGLTERQLGVLRLLGAGLTNAEIADRLVLSVRTVDHHVAAVLVKLGVHSRHQARAAAADLGLTDQPELVG